MFTAIVDRNLIGKDLTDTDTLQENKFEALVSYGKKAPGTLGPTAADRILSNSASSAESLCFSSIRKTVICIDDLERKSKNLELKDVLGLASVLKEQKQCKVVFLLNDDEEGLDDFNKYHKKS